MEWLKEHLSEELYNQLQEQLKDKEVKLVDLSKGEYVAKGKYDTEVNKNKTLTDNITELTEKVKAFDGVDLEALQKQATEWETKYNADIQKIKLDTSIEKTLMQSKARNMRAVMGLLDLEKVSLDGDNVIGLNEQLEAIKQSDAYLFDVQDTQGQQEPPRSTGVKIDNPFTKEDDSALRRAMGLPVEEK